MIDPTRASLIDHLRAAIRELQADKRAEAREHILAARRLIAGDELATCDATRSAEDRHSIGLGAFMHLCTALVDHDSAHLCSCGYTWTDRIGWTLAEVRE